jgi:hypothetical protein
MVAMTVAALTSTAGAAVSTWNVKANGGFLSLSLLNAVGLTGGTSEAAATSAPSDEAFGDGLCVTVAQASNPCPTSASSATGQALDFSQSASQTGAGTATPVPAGANHCLVPPINVVVITLSAACGVASASEDSSGDPTATGTGYLANVQVGLSLADLLGTNNIAGSLIPSTGDLCPSGTAPAASSTGTTGTAPAAGSPVDGLLGTVNSLLSGAGLSTLLPTSVAGGTSPLAPVCSILNGLVDTLTGAAGLSNLVNLNANTNILTINVGRSDSTVTTAGTVETASATQSTIDINVLGMLDIQVTPTSATVTVDKATGIATPSYTNGVLQVSTGSGVPTIITLPALSSLLNQLLSALNVGGLLQNLVGPNFRVFGGSTTQSADKTSATATSGILDLSLLNGLVALNFGDVSASGSSTTATPVVKTLAATTPTTAPAAVVPAIPAAIPNVTTVHTGEFWSGTLPIILLSGMGLAGLTLVGRRRVFSVARALSERSHKTRA